MVARVSIDVVSLKEIPVAKIVLKPLFVLSESPTNLLVLAANQSNTVLFLDGSLSSGPIGDTLEYLWVDEDQGLPFATGIEVTNTFELGTHTIALVVSDGAAIGRDSVTFEVITPADAVDELVTGLGQSGLPGKMSRPLFASLKTAAANFDRSELVAGVNQLRAFQYNLQAQLARADSATATKLTQAAQQIIDGVGSP